MIARVAARLAIAVGIALIAAGMTPPARPVPEPTYHRPVTEAEDRQWQLDRLADAIAEARTQQQ
ncbi:hypothetical protein [Micromonospora sp. NPDC003816]|uniref:hypothetical protein n=1 Tax=Micromonospora sp. NPDC003816 TaxID=3364224 RepID=UPI0036C1E7D1